MDDTKGVPAGVGAVTAKRMLETALEAEMAAELGYERGDPAGAGSGNNRNGHHTKKVAFEPRAVPMHARRIDGSTSRCSRSTRRA
jgi:transposase-like protein